MRGISLRWACISAVLLLFLGPATGAALAAGKPFVAPVTAEVTRKFQAPSDKYGPGHRGIDYKLPSGTTVRASGGGTVTFAGQVADDGLFVTIEHQGGISTTYSYLSRIDVSKGGRVTQGQAIALSGEGHAGGPAGLHFGAKKNGDYIDPEVLLKNLDDITDILALTPVEAPRDETNLAAFRDVKSPRALVGVRGAGVDAFPGSGSGSSQPRQSVDRRSRPPASTLPKPHVLGTDEVTQPIPSEVPRRFQELIRPQPGEESLPLRRPWQSPAEWWRSLPQGPRRSYRDGSGALESGSWNLGEGSRPSKPTSA